MRRIFKQEKPDIIHTHRYLSRYAVPASIFTGVKGRVHTVHSVASKEVGTVDKFINRFFYKTSLMYPVAISPEIKSTIEDIYNLGPDHIGMVYNGIDLNKCISKQSYKPNEAFKLLHVGRFQDVKNHFGIIKAFSNVCKKHDNVKLYFYGQGELLNDCIDLVRKLGIEQNVFFCGITDDVYSVMHEADLFLLCSHYEGMPMTLIEAMATGLPIVATGVGGIVDMIDDRINGLLCVDSEKDIENKIMSLIIDEKLRETIGKNAIIKSSSFSSSNMADGYLKIYNDLV